MGKYNIEGKLEIQVVIKLSKEGNITVACPVYSSGKCHHPNDFISPPCYTNPGPCAYLIKDFRFSCTSTKE